MKPGFFGNARVSHTAGELTSGRITLNLDETTMSAQALTPGDTLSEPVLEREGDRIRSQRILFNYETEKGKFDVARVRMDEASVTGKSGKTRGPPRHLHTRGHLLHLRPFDHPHYYIQADRMKIVDEDEIFFTRARLYILDIPYPLVFPFGLIPSQMRQKSAPVCWNPATSFKTSATADWACRTSAGFSISMTISPAPCAVISSRPEPS